MSKMNDFSPNAGAPDEPPKQDSSLDALSVLDALNAKKISNFVSPKNQHSTTVPIPVLSPSVKMPLGAPKVSGSSKPDLIMWKPRQSKGIPIQYVIQYLKDDETASVLYSELCIYVPFLVCFCMFFLGGRDIAGNHLVLSALRNYAIDASFPSSKSAIELLKERMVEENFNPAEIDIPPPITYQKMSSLDQWGEWLRSVILPSMWDCVNDQVPRAFYQPLGSTFRLGALRVRAIHVRGDTCGLNSNIFENTTSHPDLNLCYGDTGWGKEDKRSRCNLANPTNIRSTLYTHQDCPIILGGASTASRGIYHCGGYIVDVPYNATCASVKKLFKTFSDPECPFVDHTRTRFIALEWFVYTSPLDTFQSVKAFIEIAPTGGWDVSYQVRSFIVWQTSQWVQTLFDSLVFCFVWYYLGFVTHRWRVDYEKTLKIVHYLYDMWNVLEIVNMLTFLAVFGLRFTWMYKSYSAKVHMPFPPVYPQDLDAIQLLFLLQIYLNSLNMVISFMKLLCFLRMNNRMNILTRSMSACAESISGVLVLFAVISAAYAIAGYSVFGTRLESYRTVNSAMATLLMALIGRFDYDEMYNVNSAITPFFFWSFQIIVMFLLLNFITAILSMGFSQSSRGVALQPLNEVLLRQLESINKTLQYRNLKKVLELSIQGKSRRALLKKVVSGLEEHLELLGEMNDPLTLEKIRMHQEDFKSWLSEELHRDLGDEYMSRVWDDIEYAFETRTCSEDMSSIDKIVHSVMDGVREMCGPSVQRVESIATSLEDIELLMRTVITKIERLEAEDVEDMNAIDLGEGMSRFYEGDDNEESGADKQQFKERDFRALY